MERSLRQSLPPCGFCVSPERSRRMASIKGRGNKTTEKRLRAALVAAGVSGWQVAPRGFAGNPDFYFSKQRVAIFVDGCFWHGCRRCGHFPKTNARFWQTKIVRTQRRDRRTDAALRNAKVRVLRLWEHELRTELSRCLARIVKMVQP
jgi:DNA mismatch endonuclease (patch repair protein)